MTIALRGRRLRASFVLSLATLSSLAAIPSADSALQALCNGEIVTIFGSSASETINGTPGRDVILAGGGGDTINGRGGNDVICAGEGDDVINGGSGNDLINGGPGDDRLEGARGADELVGGDGNDTLIGGGGDDTMRGGSGGDFLSGGPGGDSMLGGQGPDRLLGGIGEDLIDGGQGTDRARGGEDWDDCYRAKRIDSCDGPAFLETFDGEPSGPTPFVSNSKMTVSTNSRIGSTRTSLPAMQADHGADCSGPPSKHTVKTYADAQFRCRNHMMTAISSGPLGNHNYAVSMFSPNSILDFSGGEAVIQFDVSTLRRSHRDWFEVWITPYNHLQRIPVQDRPSMQGPPRNAIVVALKSFTDTGSFDVELHRDFKEIQIDGPVEWIGYEDFLTPSPTVRSTFEIRITQDHIIVGMPYEPFYWISEDIPGGLPFNKGVVQFGHNSYHVFECDECGSGPNTWHWDNIYMAPAEPMTVKHANRRVVNANTASYVTFPGGAPADAHLQFTGIGFDLEVSYDNGKTWKPAVTQHNREIHHWRYKNYWMPIPAGTQRVEFRGDDPYDGRWQVQDISVLSKQLPANAYQLGESSADIALELTELPSIGCVECAKETQLDSPGREVWAVGGTPDGVSAFCTVPDKTAAASSHWAAPVAVIETRRDLLA